MKTMNFLTVIFASLLVIGCSSQPDYREAEGNGYGYQATKLTDKQYRISFKARGSDQNKAMDYALLRAAEVTKENGYDWFVVTHRETFVDRERISPQSSIGYTNSSNMVTRCGLVSCTTTHYPRSTMSAGIHIGGSESSDIQTVLEIQLGTGVQPDSEHSFEAQAVIDNLSPKTE